MNKSTEEYIKLKLEYDDNIGTVRYIDSLKEVSHYLPKESKGNRGLPCKVVNLSIKGKVVKVFMHRLVWFLCKGSWPDKTIDHIDRNKLNNRIENLRNVSTKVNNSNKIACRKNKTGFKGVIKAGNRFRSQITICGRTRYLGTFDTPELAAKAYDQAATESGEGTEVLNFPQGAVENAHPLPREMLRANDSS